MVAFAAELASSVSMSMHLEPVHARHDATPRKAEQTHHDKDSRVDAAPPLGRRRPAVLDEGSHDGEDKGHDHEGPHNRDDGSQDGDQASKGL